jgi:16S rRNA (cytidine1402-2'-O)-methyltransferase
MPGTLFVVATPLGNLEDITHRALRVLREVDLIAAEDTRHSRKLLNHYGITTPLTSYYDEIEARKAGALVRELLDGRNLALISDAGTPAIADPGFHLVRQAIDAGIAVVPIPGPSALAAALSVCGLPTDQVAFEGFLPAREGRRRRRLAEIQADPRTLVFYEAPHRVRETLADLLAVLGDRPAAVMREATKIYETVARGTLQALDAQAGDFERGEVTIVVAGAAAAAAVVPDDLDEQIAALRAAGRHTRDIADELAMKYDLPRREVYRRIVGGPTREE